MNLLRTIIQLGILSSMLTLGLSGCCIFNHNNIIPNASDQYNNQYYLVNHGKIANGTTFKIKDNDLIIHSETIKFGDNINFIFENSSSNFTGKVEIYCKKVRGKTKYTITNLKASEIDGSSARFSIIFK